MLLILVLALLFCPSLAEEELRDVKQKSMLPAGGRGMLYLKKVLFTITRKKRQGPFHFDKRPTPKFHSFGSAIPIMIFLSPEG